MDSKNSKNINTEAWREYDWNGRVYRINNPVTLVIGTTTHRVVDVDGIVHCVPNVGCHGCVLRWKTKAGYEPVAF